MAQLQLNFNPRSLAGATSLLILRYLQPLHFNPRSLAGATLSSYLIIPTLPYFNPRSLAGATVWNDKRLDSTRISIHAPSRERPICGSPFSPTILFQSTLPRGSDSLPGMLLNIALKFQSTLPRGSDKTTLKGKKTSINISIHAPSRERRGSRR